MRQATSDETHDTTGIVKSQLGLERVKDKNEAFHDRFNVQVLTIQSFMHRFLGYT